MSSHECYFVVIIQDRWFITIERAHMLNKTLNGSQGGMGIMQTNLTIAFPFYWLCNLHDTFIYQNYIIDGINISHFQRY